jgi:uncharacterized protein (DUF849 family)
MSAPCIIEVALNGVTTKDANPHVPRTPAEITSDALACIELPACPTSLDPRTSTG